MKGAGSHNRIKAHQQACPSGPVSTQQAGLQARRSLQQTPLSRTSQPPELWEMDFRCFSHPAYGVLFQHPRFTKTGRGGTGRRGNSLSINILEKCLFLANGRYLIAEVVNFLNLNDQASLVIDEIKPVNILICKSCNVSELSSGLMDSGLILILNLELKNSEVSVCLSLSLSTRSPANMSPVWRNKLVTSGNKEKLIQLFILKEITSLRVPCYGQRQPHTL